MRPTMPSLASLLTIITVFSSLSLIILATVNFYVTGHAFKTLAIYFPPGQVPWYGPDPVYVDPTSGRSVEHHFVALFYDWSSENFVWVSSGAAIVAGFVGLWCAWRGRKSSTTFSLISTIALPTTSLTLLLSLISFIYTTVKHTRLTTTTCDSRSGATPNTIFKCSRELVACKLSYMIRDDIWADNARLCRETTASRMLLIPFVVVSAVLVGVFVVSAVKARRSGARAGWGGDGAVVYSGATIQHEPDLLGRVEKVEDEEDWERAEVYEAPAYEASTFVQPRAEMASVEKVSEKGDWGEGIPYAVPGAVTRSSSRYSVDVKR